eukprot:9832176-Lingulodinium_polyedra.AAC.1
MARPPANASRARTPRGNKNSPNNNQPPLCLTAGPGTTTSKRSRGLAPTEDTRTGLYTTAAGP